MRSYRLRSYRLRSYRLRSYRLRRHRRLGANLLLIALTLISIMPKGAIGADNSSGDDRPLRLYATAESGPIGTISEASGAMINGRFSPQRQEIWSGELIRATGAGARLRIDSIGEVRLWAGALARFSTARASREENAGARVLIASLIAGEISVKLETTASAYVEAYGKVYSAALGASFRIKLREGEPKLERIKGEVIEQQSTQPRYIIRPVARQGSDLSVRARSTRQIQFQVTDEHDRPVPDVAVVLLLSGSGGQLSAGAATGSTVTATTNAQGVVTANFSAGATPATSSVTATVAGTSVSTTVGVTTVAAAAGILGASTLAIVVGAVAAGTVATVVAVKKAQGKTNQQEPVVALPPNINPK